MAGQTNRIRYSPWMVPLLSALLLVFVFSVRLLSDPDLGSHLKAGQWISEHHRVPTSDSFTFSVTGHPYIDMHWLFQLGIYQVYRFTGYEGLNLLVTLLVLTLFVLLVVRNRKAGVPLPFACLAMLTGFLIIEQRIMLRPEMITWLYMTGILMILDRYYHRRKNLLFLLPFLMILWCNTQGLYILGIILIATYYISLVVRDRKIHLNYLSWMVLSALACLVNPYFIRGILFPFELFTRFDTQNVFHQHIRELQSFWHLDHLVFEDILFICFAGVTLLTVILTFRKRKLHEILLLILFLYLALTAVRNLALFAVIAIPIFGRSLGDATRSLEKRKDPGKPVPGSRVLRMILFIFLTAVPLILIPRVVTNYYYTANQSYNRTGTGIDPGHQPVGLTDFLLRNRLDGRIVNGIALGGWLEWSLPQPVFIDGRLEVMGEAIYQEVVDSWENGLVRLENRYHPDMVAYNYVKSFPWTLYLAADPRWRIIYLDAHTAAFAKDEYAPRILSVDLGDLPHRYGLSPEYPTDEQKKILEATPETDFTAWWKGFYRNADPSVADFQNLASFCLQLKNDPVALCFFLESLRRSYNRNTSVYYALADIYRRKGQNELAGICYRKILTFDPQNETVYNALQTLEELPPETQANKLSGETEARSFFNSANQKYRYGDVRGAISDYSKAIALRPDYYKAYNNRGIAKALGLKQYKEALEDFNRAIAIKPDYADAWLGRGTAKYNLNDPAGACSDWEKASSLGNPQADDMILQYCKK
ncbi:MAG TPA: tetratricopeptide repeat protein [Bacteroidales bacterium]|nr:tetratricopeptide repeat protein [Bacteroidales bacterium]